ncbi:TP53 (predicted) [Pycnogonum litorale]
MGNESDDSYLIGLNYLGNIEAISSSDVDVNFPDLGSDMESIKKQHVEHIPSSSTKMEVKDDESGKCLVNCFNQADSTERVHGNTVLNMESWSGTYDFKFNIEDKKSNSWTYWSEQNKLYCDVAKPCQISFRTSSEPRGRSIIKAEAHFVKPYHSAEVVEKCLNHSSLQHPTNSGLEHPSLVDHFIRCESKQAEYFSEVDKRKFLRVPYEYPMRGSTYSTYLFTFTCLNSCAGGINRRQIYLTFTLEENGVPVGRQVLNLKVCRCPPRDRETEEIREQRRAQKHISRSTNSGVDITASNQSTSSKNKKYKRRHSVNEDEKVYTLQVKNKKHYIVHLALEAALVENFYMK